MHRDSTHKARSPLCKEITHQKGPQGAGTAPMRRVTTAQGQHPQGWSPGCKDITHKEGPHSTGTAPTRQGHCCARVSPTRRVPSTWDSTHKEGPYGAGTAPMRQALSHPCSPGVRAVGMAWPTGTQRLQPRRRLMKHRQRDRKLILA